MAPREISRASEFSLRVVLRPLHAILVRKRARRRTTNSLIVQHLKVRGTSEKSNGERAEHHGNGTDGFEKHRIEQLSWVYRHSPADWKFAARMMAKIRKFDIIAVLPALRNGDTTPESGIAPRTPPEISSISRAISVPKPMAMKQREIHRGASMRDEERSAEAGIRTAIRSWRRPANPHSSPIAGSTRSVCPAGIIAGSPQPGPDPDDAARRKSP